MLKYQLLSQLKKSLALLENRKMMIPRYCNQPDRFAGKNHYSMDMIPPLEFQINEMKAAIHGIEMLKHKKRLDKHIDRLEKIVDGLNDED